MGASGRFKFYPHPLVVTRELGLGFPQWPAPNFCLNQSTDSDSNPSNRVGESELKIGQSVFVSKSTSWNVLLYVQTLYTFVSLDPGY